MRPIDRRINKALKQCPKMIRGGAYGVYLKLSDRIGVKVLRHGLLDKIHVFSDRIEAVNSDLFNEALTEFNLLVKVESSGVTPKPLEVDAYQIDTGWVVGIKMRHCGDLTLADLKRKKQPLDFDSIEFSLYSKVLACGVKHLDVYSKNVIYDSKRDKFYLIDFSPDQVCESISDFEAIDAA